MLLEHTRNGPRIPRGLRLANYITLKIQTVPLKTVSNPANWHGNLIRFHVYVYYFIIISALLQLHRSVDPRSD